MIPLYNTPASARRRALNIIWTAAGEYDFEPDFMAFFQDGEPDFYLNSIIGYVHKWYDPKIMEKLYTLIDHTFLRETYDGLLWIALENCTYERESARRPVLRELRISCAKSFFREQQTKSRQQWMAQNSLVNALQEAKWHMVLQEPSGLVNPWEKHLFQELQYDASMTSEDIFIRTTGIFRRYFHFREKSYPLISNIRNFWKKQARKSLPSRIVRADKLLIGTSQSSHGGRISWQKSRETAHSNSTDLLYIENCFGAPLYSDQERSLIEQSLCTGSHQNCHLYFTDGQQKTSVQDPLIKKTLQDAYLQFEKNKKYFQENRRIFRTQIHLLAGQIQNTLLVLSQPLDLPSRTGFLCPSRVWRAVRLNDNRIFAETTEEKQADFSVDLMLDASASRLQSQEAIAAQGYVIAQSLRLCHIPVQVSSFLSLRGYTVLRLLSDYHSPDKDASVFRYFSAGWNRDGLALRGISQLMNSSPAKNRLLILLTDASPNDDRRIPSDRKQGILLSQDYSGEAAVKDTAAEVRSLRRSGIQVMAVLNSEDGSTEAARKIYGDDFVRIERIDQFSSAVGTLLQDQIEKLHS